MSKVEVRKRGFGSARDLRIRKGDLVRVLFKWQEAATPGSSCMIDYKRCSEAIVLTRPKNKTATTRVLYLSSRQTPMGKKEDQDFCSEVELWHGFTGFCRIVPAKDMKKGIKRLIKELEEFK